MRSTRPHDRFAMVGGMRTHYLEAGTGPSVLLLHSGEFGGCAETSWKHLMSDIGAAGYHVVAPDWLGFGESDKVVDFADPRGRRLAHMAAVMDHLGLDCPALVGSSMGGTYLAQDLASPKPQLRAAAAVLVAAGGFIPDNDARRTVQNYDLTPESMADILRVIFYSPRFADDPDYVAWRHRLSTAPGAWQATASARLRPPHPASAVCEFGRPDTTNYEAIEIPVQVMAGRNDPLRIDGYATELATRLPDSELVLFEDCGHLPNIEHPELFTTKLLSFLDRRYRPSDE